MRICSYLVFKLMFLCGPRPHWDCGMEVGRLSHCVANSPEARFQTEAMFFLVSSPLRSPPDLAPEPRPRLSGVRPDARYGALGGVRPDARIEP